jgi:hypothetical protein
VTSTISDGGLGAIVRTLIAKLPRPALIASAELSETPLRFQQDGRTGAWLSMTSNAVGLVDRFEARWAAEIITAAVWHEAGRSNAVVSGGGIEFSSPSVTGADDGTRYLFANDAASYLYTNKSDGPAKLAVPEADLRRAVLARATQIHASVTSITVFTVLGTNAIVVATARSLEMVDTSVNPFPDPDEMEGACFILLDPNRNVLAMWSWSTGLLAGHT